MEEKQQLFQQVIEAFKVDKFNPKEAQEYLNWIRLYLEYHGLKNPTNLQSNQVKEFLLYLSEEKRLMPSKQKQAYLALNFFYDKVLQRSIWAKVNISDSDEITQSVQKAKEEFSSVRKAPAGLDWINYLQEPYRLLAKITYQCGLQLEEVINIRLEDVDIEGYQLRLRDSLGIFTEIELSDDLLQPLSLQLVKAKNTYQQDCRQGSVFFKNPVVSQRKGLTSNSRWYFLFPGKLHFNLTTQKRVREQMEIMVIKNTFSQAKIACQQKSASVAIPAAVSSSSVASTRKLAAF